MHSVSGVTALDRLSASRVAVEDRDGTGARVGATLQSCMT